MNFIGRLSHELLMNFRNIYIYIYVYIYIIYIIYYIYYIYVLYIIYIYIYIILFNLCIYELLKRTNFGAQLTFVLDKAANTCAPGIAAKPKLLTKGGSSL